MNRVQKWMNQNSFFTSSFIYVFSNFLTTGIVFITTPIFTRFMTTSDYGMTSVYSTWTSVVVAIFGLQTSSSIATAYIRMEEDEFNPYMSSILFLSTISFFVAFCVGCIFQSFFAGLLNMTGSLFLVMLVESFSSYTRNFYGSYLIQTKKPIQSLVLSVITSISTVALSLIFVINMENQRYIGRILGNFIPTLIIAIVLFFIIMVKGKKFCSLKAWKFCLPLTLPIILHVLSQLILGQSDRVMLQNMTDNSTTGIYSFAYSIASIFTVLWSSANNAWVPWYFDKTKKKDVESINKTAKIYLVLISLLAGAIMLVSPEIMYILAPESYWSAGRIISIVIFGIYFSYLYTFAVNYEFYMANTKWIAAGTIAAAIINIILNYFLIPSIGGVGAAIATLISYIVLFIFHNIIVAFMKGFNIKRRLYLIGIFITSVSFILINITYEFGVLRWVLIGSGMVILYIKYRHVIKEKFKKIRQ